MTEREKFRIQEVKEFIAERAGYQCEYKNEAGNRCTERGIELAHIISKSKMNLKKYGPEIVHHPKLMLWVCKSHNDSCNAGFEPAVISKLIQEIKEAGIENWG